MTAAFIPGNRAYWCESCSGVSGSHICPRCGSANTHPLMAWLERKETQLRLERIGNVWEMWRESE